MQKLQQLQFLMAKTKRPRSATKPADPPAVEPCEFETSTGHAIPSRVAQELIRLRLHAMPFVVAKRVWVELLSEGERAKLGGDCRTAYGKSEGTVGMWMQVRRGSYERSLLEIEHGLDTLSQGRFAQLMAAIGEEDSRQPPSRLPVWNKKTCTLHFAGKVIRKVRGLKTASNVVRILNEFQDFDWPERIENPLPPGVSGFRLRETIRTLNRGLKLVRFRADGSGEGIIWERRYPLGAQLPFWLITHASPTRRP